MSVPSSRSDGNEMRHHPTMGSTVELLGKVSVEKSAAGVVEQPPSNPFQGSSPSSASSQIALAGDRRRCIGGATYQSSTRPDSSSHSV
jgi:hypothetical protein